jgi:hypothetical protein
MADAIGIAGLAIAVFDQLLKLGERTAQTIQDIRTFAEVLATEHLGCIESQTLTGYSQGLEARIRDDQKRAWHHQGSEVFVV